MAESVLIHYSPVNPENAAWTISNSQGEIVSKIVLGSLKDLSTVTENRKSIVLLDSTFVHLNSIELPTQNRQKLQRAIPYALEDQIAEDVDDLHFVVGDQLDNNKVPAVAISNENLTQIISNFEECNINVDSILPDVLALTADKNQWSIILYDDTALTQFDASTGIECEIENLDILLQAQLNNDEDKNPEKIIIFQSDSDDTKITLPESFDGETIYVKYNNHPLVVFATNYKSSLKFNLLQGAYKPKSKSSVNWGRWQLASILTGVWLSLYLGIGVYELNELSNQNTYIHGQIEKTFKSAFPKTKKLHNLRLRMEQKLAELQSGGGTEDSLLTLLTLSISALSEDQSMQIQTIVYKNNKMSIDLHCKDLQSFETLNKKLNNISSIKSEISSSSSEKDLVKGTIRIQMSGS